jgi:hypothetical protein
MTDRSNRGLGQPFRAKRFVRVEVIGIQSADFIKARGHMCAAYRGRTHGCTRPHRNLLFPLAKTGPSTHGSVCLNSFWRFAQWISALIMPPPSLVSAR